MLILIIFCFIVDAIYTRDLIVDFNVNYLAKFGILKSLKKKISLIRFVKATNKNDFCLNATFIFQ